jgi:hypothetical protein
VTQNLVGDGGSVSYINARHKKVPERCSGLYLEK